MNKQVLTLAIIVVAATILYIITGYFQTQNLAIPCTQDARICPNGTTIKRTGPNCLFPACPIKTQTISPTITPAINYKCPTGSYVDCMPGPNKIKPDCTSQYLQWAKANCPGFKGAAY
ncbi:hypothetical protein D4R99_02795 [bacterium]|nr:MAG: hypothetical protein D4R99_02795 [bacterium]